MKLSTYWESVLLVYEKIADSKKKNTQRQRAHTLPKRSIVTDKLRKFDNPNKPLTPTDGLITVQDTESGFSGQDNERVIQDGTDEFLRFLDDVS